MDDMMLWYNKPANIWEEALPIGNGRLGGMVFGEIHTERIQLNEDSVWYGGPMDRNNPDALEKLPEIRRLIFEGHMQQAEKLAAFALSGIPEGQRHYEPLGDFYLFFAGQEDNIDGYRRELDLSKGIARVEYTSGEISYTREIFASYPHEAIIIRLTADKPGSISFHTQLSRGNEIWNYDHFSKYKFKYQVGFNAYVDKSYAISPDCSVMSAQCGGKNAIKFASAVRVCNEGGTIKTLGNSIIIEGADAATIFLAASTTFRCPDPLKSCLDRIKGIIAKPYDTIRDIHVRDYQILFGRVELKIKSQNNPDCSNLPTDQRLELLRQGTEDLDLISLYFQYGRYLLIACSRPGTLPANLQGIWNKDMLPVWDSKYTININTQMNYWPAETCNLSECHLPLFDHLERMKEPGRKTARVMYGCRGFMAHHNTDIWADTAPQDVCLSSTFWTMGAAWLALHLWDHYEFTQDIDFLKSAYETMKEAAEFFIDFLVEDPNGRLVVCPSLSPENEYQLSNGEKSVLCAGASMDSQIIHELFTDCIKAADVLNIDSDFCIDLMKIINKVPRIEIGKHGQIKEWAEEYEEVDLGHRHISHLFALHPGSGITPLKTPSLAAAARITLERRLSHGGGHTGWSRAWIINMWARLHDGEKAYENVLELIKKSTLPNLFDNHPPFQIDGNFGGTAGIAEMLVQSHEGVINIIPAVPAVWKDGQVKGLRVRGGATVDFSWADGRMEALTLVAENDRTFKLMSGNKVIEINLKKGNTYYFDSSLNCTGLIPT